ncbi:DNA polymerase beta superfamily protein [Bacillus dakarensis]|uniref:nucleotidyltransferase domain-containing protein n=1 Tax=Robertmurraya dakarensis TaxID=1926278 RepID=UPI000981A85C|nr:nucleotidyltransferase domain-containing protein [Bacillus dakarensis]
MENWLRRYAQERNIDILFACEAGSYTWGTQSGDSDQDIRFIYKHQDIRSYLSLKRPPDVLDGSCPYDVQGWDIFKAFQLLSKSNPSLYEWAFSPIVYIDDDFSATLKYLISHCYSAYSLAQHYRHLMSRNLKDLSGKNTYTLRHQKQLIQALRAVIITKKIIKNKGIDDAGPYFSFESDETDILYAFYRNLVYAKKRGEVVPPSNMREMIRFLETGKQQLELEIKDLPKGNESIPFLNEWIWKILKL